MSLADRFPIDSDEAPRRAVMAYRCARNVRDRDATFWSDITGNSSSRRAAALVRHLEEAFPGLAPDWSVLAGQIGVGSPKDSWVAEVRRARQTRAPLVWTLTPEELEAGPVAPPTLPTGPVLMDTAL